jgi:hypothetical protein
MLVPYLYTTAEEKRVFTIFVNKLERKTVASKTD